MYDIIIIGGGAAGLSAAIYAMRGGMKTLVLEKVATGGQATKTYEIDNYPGFANAPSGPELMQEFLKHAQKYDVENRIFYTGIKDEFVTHGSINELLDYCKLDEEGILESLLKIKNLIFLYSIPLPLLY